MTAAERLLAMEEIAGLAAATATRTIQFDDRYVDTADGALARAGFAARLRTTPAGTIVSVKSTANHGPAGGAHRREELEGPADRTAGPVEWPPSDARSLVLELCGDAPLVELLTIRQLRRRRLFRDERATVELSLDEVDVVARSQVIDRWLEVEVELVKGDEGRLAAVATALDGSRDFTPARGSKLETALAAVRAHTRRHGPVPEADPRPAALPRMTPRPPVESVASADRAAGPAKARGAITVARQGKTRSRSAPFAPERGAGGDELARSADSERPTGGDILAVSELAVSELAVSGLAAPDGQEPRNPPVPPLPSSPGVLADDHIAEAGRKILRFHFARMQAREPGTRDGTRPQDLHGMRVATRRMRAGWRIFGDGFRTGRTRRLRLRLREVASRLGGVRDLDVLLESLDAYRAELSPVERRDLDPLAAAWQSYRADARELLAHELDSAAYARFVEELRLFVQTEGSAVREFAPTEPHHVRDTAPSRIWQAYERVRAYEPVLRWADVETLHDLRIAAKWLRYSVEFVREPLGPDAEALIPRVVALQDHLGVLHDADVGAAMTRRFLAERGPALTAAQAAAATSYLVSREREVARLRQGVGAPWRPIVARSFRRRLARAVAAL